MTLDKVWIYFEKCSSPKQSTNKDKHIERVGLLREDPIITHSELDNIYKIHTLQELSDLNIQNFTILELWFEDIEGETFTTNLHAISYIISYLLIVYEDDNISNILLKTTKPTQIGVTIDIQECMFTSLKTKLPNSNFYFYYNGLNRLLIEYLCDIFDQLNISKDTLKFMYTDI